MIWFNSKAGHKWREIMVRASGQTKIDEVIAWIFLKTKINPRVIQEWMNGGNPSIKNLNITLEAANASVTEIADIIDNTRDFKNNHRDSSLNVNKFDVLVFTLRNNPKLVDELHAQYCTDRNVPTELVLRVADFDIKTKKYIFRVYRKSDNKYICRERSSMYNYGKSLVNSNQFISQVAVQFGSKNFTLTYDEAGSIKEIK